MAHKVLETLRSVLNPRTDPSTRESRYSDDFDVQPPSIWPQPPAEEAASFRNLINSQAATNLERELSAVTDESREPRITDLDLSIQCGIVGQIYLSGRSYSYARPAAMATYLQQEFDVEIGISDVKELRTMLGTTPFTSDIPHYPPGSIEGLLESYLETGPGEDDPSPELQLYKLKLNDYWWGMSLEERNARLEKWRAKAFYINLRTSPERSSPSCLTSSETDHYLFSSLLPGLEFDPSIYYGIIAEIWLSYQKVWPDAIASECMAAYLMAKFKVRMEPGLIDHVRNDLRACRYRVPSNPKAEHRLIRLAFRYLADVDRWWEKSLVALDRERLLVLWRAGDSPELVPE